MKIYVYEAMPAFHNLLGLGGTFTYPIVEIYSLEFYLKFLHSWARLVYSLPLGACQICYQGHVCLKKESGYFHLFSKSWNSLYNTEIILFLESLKELSKAFWYFKTLHLAQVCACACGATTHTGVHVDTTMFVYIPNDTLRSWSLM